MSQRRRPRFYYSDAYARVRDDWEAWRTLATRAGTGSTTPPRHIKEYMDNQGDTYEEQIRRCRRRSVRTYVGVLGAII